MRKRSWQRWLKWATITTAAVLVGGVVAAWLLFQYIPAWYHPLEVPPDEVQSVRDTFVSAFDRLSEALNTSAGPFEFELRQDQVNAWLSTREQMWPESRHWLPPGVTYPQVIFDRDTVRLAATFRHGSLQTVASAQLAIRADADGIHVKLLRVSAGSLPVPRSQVREFFRMVDRQNWPAGQRVRDQLGDRPLPALTGLYEGIIFPSGWIWQNGRLPFQVNQISCQPGKLILTLQPLPRQFDRSELSPSPATWDFTPIQRISPGSAPAGSR
jgi:hypothetical protein